MSVISPETMPEMMFASPRGPLGATLPLTLSGNEITDGVRAAALQGDGRSPDGSMGIWEATTNLCANGGFETSLSSGGVAWAARGTGVTGAARVTSDAKFGSACATCTMGATWQSDWGLANGSPYIAISPSTVYTLSAWVKSDGVHKVQIKAYQRDSGGVPIGVPIVGSHSTSTSWTRVSVTWTTNGSAAYLQIVIGGEGSSDVSFTFYVDGVQLELQPLATPYVETNGGTASRSASRVQVPVAQVMDETQGWVAARVRLNWPSTADPMAPNGPTIWKWGDAITTSLLLSYQPSTDRWRQWRKNAGVGADAFSAADSFSSGDERTLIGAWTAAGTKISVNGVAFVSSANVTVPTLAATLSTVGEDPDATAWLDGDFFWFACGLGTLTDADAAAIHANGNPEPPFGLFPDAADLRMIWKPRNSIARQFYG